LKGVKHSRGGMSVGCRRVEASQGCDITVETIRSLPQVLEQIDRQTDRQTERKETKNHADTQKINLSEF
jgi:hypothetical protein